MKKINWQVLTIAVILVLGLATLGLASGGVPQISTLSGTVTADGLVAPGASVSEGQVLVNVKTVAGPMPAARANVAGTVNSVLVTAGQNITSGQTVAEITAK